MKKNPEIFIRHILDAIEHIEKYLEHVTENDFLKSPQLQDAVIRRIEIIGEAAKNVPEDFKRKYTEIQWRQIEGMRNALIHGYFGIDLVLVWNVALTDLPKLKKQIQNLLD